MIYNMYNLFYNSVHPPPVSTQRGKFDHPLLTMSILFVILFISLHLKNILQFICIKDS